MRAPPSQNGAQFFRFSADLCCALTESFTFSEVNPAWRAVGWQPERLIGRSFVGLVHPSARHEAAHQLQQLLEGNATSAQFEAPLAREDGSWVALAWAWGTDRRVLYGSARPLPSRLASQRPSDDDALRLRAILDSMEEGVIVQDQAGQVISTNAAAERILRRSVPDLHTQNAYGPPLAPLIRRDGTPFPDAERPAAHVLRTGETVTNSVLGLQMGPGNTTWISTNATPLRSSPLATIQGVVLTIRDITEQVRLQEALEASLDNFRSLVASLPVGIAVSHGRTMRYVNRALVNILGYDDASELEGRDTSSVIHPSSERALSDRYAGMSEGKHPPPGTLECCKKSGGTVLIEVTSMPTVFEGKPAILAIIRDVTESHRAKQAQERSEARFRALVNFAPVGIFETNLQGQCVYANERVADITGLSVDQVLGEGWIRAVVTDDLDGIQSARERAKTAGTGLVYDLRFAADRGTVYAQVRSVPLVNEGATTGYLGALVDLTELRAAELALAQSEESMRTLTTRAPIGIGVRIGAKLVFGNPALAQMLGVSSTDELIGKDMVAAAAPEARARLHERHKQLALGERLPREIFPYPRSDGSIAMIEIDSQNIEYQGGPATMSLMRDVTELERTRAERDAVHAQLIDSLHEKQTLLQEIHHRVKNNLQVIASLLRLGRRYVKDRDALNVFDDSIARVHSIALIHERLYQAENLSKIHMPTYFDGLVGEIVRAHSTSHRLKVQVRCDDLFFNMDRCVPIGLIVNELVSNALKHAFSKSVAAERPEVSVDLSATGENCALVVRDNGAGMTGSGDKRDSLGLRLVASLTKQLHGESNMVSENGTEWRVVFPSSTVRNEEQE